MLDTLRLAIASQADVERARREARSLASIVGLDAIATESIALTVTELATNLVRYAWGGELIVSVVGTLERQGIQVESCDHGPGIPNTDHALTDGFSTGGGLGSGLPGARRLMDEFELTSDPRGTRVVARKWAAVR